MLILILFYFVGQVFISNVSPLPSPFSAAVYFNPIITSTALPRPFPIPGFGGAAHVSVVKLAAIWRSSLSGSPYKQPHFTVSLVVPVEIWKSTNPFPLVLVAHTVIFSLVLLNWSNFILFCISLLFLTIVDFFAMQLSHRSPLGVQGACSSFPSDVPLVIWHMGMTSWEKTTSQHDIFVSNLNISFAQDLITNAIVAVSLLIPDVPW